jgi:hypothetical protein
LVRGSTQATLSALLPLSGLLATLLLGSLRLGLLLLASLLLALLLLTWLPLGGLLLSRLLLTRLLLTRLLALTSLPLLILPTLLLPLLLLTLLLALLLLGLLLLGLLLTLLLCFSGVALHLLIQLPAQVFQPLAGLSERLSLVTQDSFRCPLDPLAELTNSFAGRPLLLLGVLSQTLSHRAFGRLQRLVELTLLHAAGCIVEPLRQ